jgi:hypothetical protein
MHAAIELALGAALIVLPFPLGLAPATVIAGIAIGAVLAGLAISGSEPSGRGGLALSTHAAYDWGAGSGLLCAAVVLGLATGPASLILFLAAGFAELALIASTSYTASRA